VTALGSGLWPVREIFPVSRSDDPSIVVEPAQRRRGYRIRFSLLVIAELVGRASQQYGDQLDAQ